ncbi:MAG: hypothetical protein CFE45_21955, partial [Burkholderiales bacterium PBB5]
MRGACDGLSARPRPEPVSRAQAVALWLKLDFISVGGPAGQIALMHQELVARRSWSSEHRFLHPLNFCMVPPGPEAQQLATCIGWLTRRSWGGVVAGLLRFKRGVIPVVLGCGLAGHRLAARPPAGGQAGIPGGDPAFAWGAAAHNRGPWHAFPPRSPPTARARGAASAPPPAGGVPAWGAGRCGRPWPPPQPLQQSP